MTEPGNLWLAWLAGEELAPEAAQRLRTALAADPTWRAQMLADLGCHGALRGLAAGDGQVFTGLVMRRLDATEDASGLLRAVHGRLPQHDGPKPGARRGRFGWWMSAFAAMLVIAVGVFRPWAGEPACAILGLTTADLRVVRAERDVAVQAGMPLLSKDRLLVGANPASGLVEVRYPDGSVMTVLADTDMQVRTEVGAKCVHLAHGEVHCAVTKQPPGKSMRLLTAQAEVEVVGTRFTVQADGLRTRLVVAEGMVLFRRTDGTASLVQGGGVAEAGVPGQPPAAALARSGGVLLSRTFDDGFLDPDTIGTIAADPDRPGNRCLAGQDILENGVTRARLCDEHKGLLTYQTGAELTFDYWIDQSGGALNFYFWNRTQAKSMGGFTIAAPELVCGRWGHARVRLSDLRADQDRVRDGDLITELTMQTGAGYGALLVDNVRIVGRPPP